MPRHLLTQGNSSLLIFQCPLGAALPVFTVAPEMLAWGYTARTQGSRREEETSMHSPCQNPFFFAAAAQKQISTHLSHAGGGRILPRMKPRLPNFLLVFPIQGVGSVPRKSARGSYNKLKKDNLQGSEIFNKRKSVNGNIPAN